MRPESLQKRESEISLFTNQNGEPTLLGEAILELNNATMNTDHYDGVAIELALKSMTSAIILEFKPGGSKEQFIRLTGIGSRTAESAHLFAKDNGDMKRSKKFKEMQDSYNYIAQLI